MLCLKKFKKFFCACHARGMTSTTKPVQFKQTSNLNKFETEILIGGSQKKETKKIKIQKEKQWL